MENPKDLIRQFHHRARKGLGQNFLIDVQALYCLADLALPDLPILEVGPGVGALTQLLLKYGYHVKAVELDPDAVAFLNKKWPELKVIHDDILKWKWEMKGEVWQLMGNLPYHISTQVFFKSIEWLPQWRQAIWMFQREVAERFVARPGTKAYGVLSIMAAYYFQTEYVCTLNPHSFRPRPKIQSAIVVFKPLQKRLLKSAEEEETLRSIVRYAFGKRRKTLSNALKGFYQFDKKEILDILKEVDIDPQLRAERLDIKTFVALTRTFLKYKRSFKIQK